MCAKYPAGIGRIQRQLEVKNSAAGRHEGGRPPVLREEYDNEPVQNLWSRFSEAIDMVFLFIANDSMPDSSDLCSYVYQYQI